MNLDGNDKKSRTLLFRIRRIAYTSGQGVNDSNSRNSMDRKIIILYMNAKYYSQDNSVGRSGVANIFIWRGGEG